MPTMDTVNQNPYNGFAQQNLQNIATVEQSNEQFINNTSKTTVKTEDKPSTGISMTFVIILFAIILGVVFFVFPYIFDKM